MRLVTALEISLVCYITDTVADGGRSGANIPVKIQATLAKDVSGVAFGTSNFQDKTSDASATKPIPPSTIPEEILPWWRQLSTLPLNISSVSITPESQSGIPPALEYAGSEFRHFVQPLVLNFIELAHVMDKYNWYKFKLGGKAAGTQSTVIPFRGFPVDMSEYIKDDEEVGRLEEIIKRKLKDQMSERQLWGLIDDKIDEFRKIGSYCASKGWKTAQSAAEGEDWLKKAETVKGGFQIFVANHQLWAPFDFRFAYLQTQQLRGEIRDQMFGPGARTPKQSNQDWINWLKDGVTIIRKPVTTIQADKKRNYMNSLLREFTAVLKKAVINEYKGKGQSLAQAARDKRYILLKEFDAGLTMGPISNPAIAIKLKDFPYDDLLKLVHDPKPPRKGNMISKMVASGLGEKMEKQAAAAIGYKAETVNKLDQSRARLTKESAHNN